MSVHPLRLRHRHEPALDSSILHVLPANIAVLGADGTILAVNEASKRFATANGFTENAHAGIRHVPDKTLGCSRTRVRTPQLVSAAMVS